MATIQISVPKGGSLNGLPASLNVTEATGGGAPAGVVDVNIATASSRAEVIKALQLAIEKVMQSTNLP